MPLTDTAVRNAKSRAKKYKIYDGDGLYLEVLPTGSKYWRMKYFFAGKEKRLALGVYPHISLADARDRRAQAQKVLANGNDPGEVKRESKRAAAFKSANTFEAIGREWFEKRKDGWTPSYSERTLAQLERYIFAKLGPRPIADIPASEVLAMLRAVEAKGILETAHRMMQLTAQIFMVIV